MRRRLEARRTISALALLAVVLAASCRPATTGPGSNGEVGGSGASAADPSASFTSNTPKLSPAGVDGTVSPPPLGAWLGVSRPPAPFDIDALDKFEQVTGRRAAVVMWYQAWGPTGMRAFDAAACVSVYRRGAIPVITWEPWEPGKEAHTLKDPANQPRFSLVNIVDGKFDVYIRKWAQAARSLGGPLMLRPMHEMNGTWYPWGGTVNGNTPELYVRAWRHIHDVFKAEGATNVTWVWSINRESMPGTPGYAAYYPGDDYVDWTAISGFNFGDDGAGSTWHQFDFLYASSLSYLRTLGKPIMLAEIGSAESGDKKSRWVADALSRIVAYPSIKAVVWYDQLEQNTRAKHDFRVDSSPEALAAFRQGISSPYYVGGPVAPVSDWVEGLSQEDRRVLRSFQPVY